MNPVIIYRAHRLAGRKAEIYGICTDSCRWNFMYINKKGRVSEPHPLYKVDVHVFRSPIYHRTGCMICNELSGMVRSIIREAVALHRNAGGSPRRLETCSELTGCKVL
ncbi:hypothetical protein BDV36DRAFT_18912 [Aspergillus pseudocaelatus]|uniref:Uncharacterized protein n=1 Tax=Aspergillus pseudocaelatus TaxID=1825620 RepID=A0ABQ6WZF6_9EURO|nr:hypothetical protein BDV36DRAFT_18912 [Aspergillus pseudocaelatus]